MNRPHHLLRLVVSFASFFLLLQAQAQINLSDYNQNAYKADWKAIEGFNKKGQYKSSREKILELLDRSKQDNNPAQLVKSSYALFLLDAQYSEDGFTAALPALVETAEAAEFPARSFLYALLGKFYSDYLSDNIYVIRDRTAIEGGAGDNLETWTVVDFTRAILESFDESLSDERIWELSLDLFKPVLEISSEAAPMFPFLGDFLVYRAIDHLRNERNYLTEPSYAFVLDQEEAFAEVVDFVGFAFPAKDSTSYKLKALQLFQEYLSMILRKETPDVLVHADLMRLEFVLENSLLPQKESLYEEALLRLHEIYFTQEASAAIAWKLAQLYKKKGDRYHASAISQVELLQSEERNALKEALRWCNVAATRYPESFAAGQCTALAAQIRKSDIQTTNEEVYLPGEPGLVQVTFRNCEKLQAFLLKEPDPIVKDYWAIFRKGANLEKDKRLIRQWPVGLPQTNDFQQHTTEIALPPLSPGLYALVLTPGHPDSLQAGFYFTVSELGLVRSQSADLEERLFYVVNRRTGKPLEAARLSWEDQKGKVIEAYSDATGRVAYPEHLSEGTYRWWLEYGSEKRLLESREYIWSGESRYYKREISEPLADEDNINTRFFLDRAVYRPGQQVYFKGLIVNDNKTNEPSVVANKEIKVLLKDANWQLIAEKAFTSNEFGTFNGVFDLPEAGLLGRFQISVGEGSGRESFLVEAYKRPKFEVTFDPLEGFFALGDSVTVRCSAQAYSGQPIDNGLVTFQVLRTPQFVFRPWWMDFFTGRDRLSEAKVMLTGEGKTDAFGHFSLNFLAEAGTVASSYKPDGYRFEVRINITDINGESHSVTKTIHIGNAPVQASLQVGKHQFTDRALELSFETRNWEGQQVDHPVRVEIFELDAPQHIKQSRLWTVPDLPLYSKEAFHELFPMMAYGTEAHRELYQPKATVFEGTFGKPELILLSPEAWKPGLYRVVLSLSMPDGDSLQTETYFDLLDTVQHKIPAPIQFFAGAFTHPLEPGHDARFELFSGEEQIQLFFRLSRGESLLHQDWHAMEQVFTFPYKIQEADRGNLIANGFFVKNNRFTSFNQVAEVPWTNKQLSIQWRAFRDKLQPGEKETWELHLQDHLGKGVLAELGVTLYDESLDAIAKHNWQLNLYHSRWSSPWLDDEQDFNDTNFGWGNDNQIVPSIPYFSYPQLAEIPGLYDFFGRIIPAVAYQMKSSPLMDAAEGEPVAMEMSMEMEEAPAPSEQETSDAEVSLRENLDELVFFKPEIHTDASGKAVLEFTMNEALTRWKVMAVAHTRDLATGTVTRSLLTQIPLMIVPNVPRFLRSGDQVLLSAKISNMTAEAIDGTAKLNLFNAIDGSAVDVLFGHDLRQKEYHCPAGGSVEVSWEVKVPEETDLVLQYDMYALADDFSDGERNVLPILSNRTLITESNPVFLRPGKSKEVKLERIAKLQQSESFAMHRFSLEATPNPVWYAIQTLPYLNEYPFDCTEQLFNKLFAQLVGNGIVQANEGIQKAIARYDGNSSPLELNQELKANLLAETPWVLDAGRESSVMEDLVRFLDKQGTEEQIQQLFKLLSERQSPSGGFSWFPGGRDSWYITQYVLEGLVRLQEMGLLDRLAVDDLMQNAIGFIDGAAEQHLEELKKLAKGQGVGYLKRNHLSPLLVHYLFVRSRPATQKLQKPDAAYNFFLDQALTYWPDHSIYLKGLIAMTFHSEGKKKPLKQIFRTLREQSFTDEEMGMYWKNTGGWFWYEDPIETQALLIALFAETGQSASEIDEMRLWLLKNKQVRQWRSTKATAAAVFSLVNYGSNWVENPGTVEVSFPEAESEMYSSEMNKAGKNAAAGSGYWKAAWERDDFHPELGEMSWENKGNSPAWGAAYWQYFEDFDKVDAFGGEAISIKKALYMEATTEEGRKLIPVGDGSRLKPGDRIVVRMEINTDRDMEYVHLKDTRAAGLEPTQVRSGYEYAHGLGYYRQTRDTATDFFMDYLPKGAHVFEYSLVVSHRGDFSAGLTTLQCMYAPEFRAHSKGGRLSVR